MAWNKHKKTTKPEMFSNSDKKKTKEKPADKNKPALNGNVR